MNGSPNANVHGPDLGQLNAQLRWLDKHIAITANNNARLVHRRAMYPHTADEIIGGLKRIRASLEWQRDQKAQAQQEQHAA